MNQVYQSSLWYDLGLTSLNEYNKDFDDIIYRPSIEMVQKFGISSVHMVAFKKNHLFLNLGAPFRQQVHDSC